MAKAFKCLKTADGIIALVDINGSDFSELNQEDVSILLCEVGLLIKIKEVEILVPEGFLAFLCEHRAISIYPFNSGNYMESPILTLELAIEALIKAKGIYDFWKGHLKEREKGNDLNVN